MTSFLFGMISAAIYSASALMSKGPSEYPLEGCNTTQYFPFSSGPLTSANTVSIFCLPAGHNFANLNDMAVESIEPS